MKPFKFFQKGTLNDPQMLNEITRATASFNNRDYVDRITGAMNLDMVRERRIIEDAETAYRFRLRGAGRANGNTHTDNHGNIDYVPFSFGTTRVTRVNPKWWMKIKMFFQKLFLYSDQIFPIIIFSTLITVIVSAVIAKILNVW